MSRFCGAGFSLQGRDSSRPRSTETNLGAAGRSAGATSAPWDLAATSGVRSLRVAILGYGAVAAIHAARMRGRAGVKLTAVYGPNADKARAFAAAHGIATATDSLDDALRNADAAVICSPSARHAEQAACALEAGLHVLVELPACATLAEAEGLAEIAARQPQVLQCAHTSRCLEPYRRLGHAIAQGRLGEIQQIHYVRQIEPRVRSWEDDALRHHAAHPLDLVRLWCGYVRALACAAHPRIGCCRNLSLTGELTHGAPVTVAISYTARLPRVLMTVIGSEHTVETDGFTFLKSDLPDLCGSYDAQRSYESAIEEQDAAFVGCCLGEPGGVAWDETIALVRLVDQFRDLWRRV
jgi:2-hydroxy-4-carboxymuconate semialdehyde hemiacetal dehydrogenase